MSKSHLILFGAAAVAGYLFAAKLSNYQPFKLAFDVGGSI